MTIENNPSSRAAGGTERPRRPVSVRSRRTLGFAVLGIAAVALAACGGASAASSTSSTTSPSGSGTGTAGATRSFPGASGTIAAITGTSLEVQNPNTGQTTVTYTPTTTFTQTVSASAADVTVGSCISAFGKPTSSSSSSSKTPLGEPVTATTVTISAPTSSGCTGGFGGGGGFRFAGGSTGNGTPPQGGEYPFHRPSNGSAFHRFAGQFGAATGSVASVSGSTVEVNETNPRTKATSTVAVTLTSSTTFTQRTTASSANLAVGQCATAFGSASTTGAITANSISLSSPVNGSCTAGRFGGFGGAPGGAPSA